MDYQNKIPTGKVSRATRFIKTGIKVSGNYAAHYAKKIIGESDKEELERKNAEEIFNMLSQLKGTALKIAQMLSMDTGILPKAYAEKFINAQNNALRLSGPLVMNTFQKYTGMAPGDMFDSFNMQAIAAASIGQVHEAYKDGKRLAVKIQYPGVAENIHSDISMAKPFILRYMGVSATAVQQYVEEITERLIEETDYVKELQNGLEAHEIAMLHRDVVVPKFYPEFSSKKVLTMEWLEGKTLNEFIETEKNQEKRNAVGQALVNFFQDQVHIKKKFHADLHPGNFIITDDYKLGVIDFGCTKALPDVVYENYFALADNNVLEDKEKLKSIFIKLDFLRESDTSEEMEMYWDIILKTIELISRPLRVDSFDFSDEQYNIDLQTFGDQLNKDERLKNDNAARGSRHTLFLHRAFIGLFGILYNLKAQVSFSRSFVGNIHL